MSSNSYLSIAALLIVVGFAIVGDFLIKMITKAQETKKKSEKAWYHFITIPPLIGMIVLGCLARNIIPPSVMDHYNDSWASYIRMVCLAVILLRGGLELEFKGKGLLVLLLIILPSGCESTTVALVSKSVFDLPITFAFALGFVFAAVSPAILVPSLMNLHMKGYGTAKGIPVSLIASGSLEDALMITLFGICTTIGWNEVGVTNSSPGFLILQNIYEIFGGIAAGVILGLLMLLLRKFRMEIKCGFSFCLAIAFTVVCQIIKASQAKYVGVIAFGYVCFRVWGKDKPKKELAFLWNYMTPFLFGSIGAAVRFDIINGSIISKSIGIVLLGLFVRCFVAFLLSGVRRDFVWREKLFIALAWIPKATVQAALGGLVLDMARQEKEKLGEKSSEFINYGLSILTVTVFAIVIAAPLGAILINSLGTKFLEKKVELLENEKKDEENDFDDKKLTSADEK